jgi:hypothetical protein
MEYRKGGVGFIEMVVPVNYGYNRKPSIIIYGYCILFDSHKINFAKPRPLWALQ